MREGKIVQISSAVFLLCAYQGSSTLLSLIPSSYSAQKKGRKERPNHRALIRAMVTCAHAKDSHLELQTVKWRVCTPGALFVPQRSFFNPRLPWSKGAHGPHEVPNFCSIATKDAIFHPLSHIIAAPPICLRLSVLWARPLITILSQASRQKWTILCSQMSSTW